MEEPFPEAAASRATPAATVIVAADDYGYGRSYDRGLLEAAAAGAVDAVSAMVLREACDPEPLLATGVEIGLHLELAAELVGGGRSRAGPEQRAAAIADARRQFERFEGLFGPPPAYLDGHHHCHAEPGLAAALGRLAREWGVPVRSVDTRHRRLLRCQGVATPDRLVGRMSGGEPALPNELRPLVERSGGPPPGVTEWMVHPGRADPDAASAYDLAREEDLELLLRLSLDDRFRALRRSHLGALG